MLLLLIVVAVAQAKTVRYSNVPPPAAIATKTYDLQVPGAAPIRIIEAEPIWSPEYEHRKPKYSKDYFTTQSTQSTISEPETSNSHAQEGLTSFLKQYSQKVKEGRKKFDATTEESTTEEPINKLASIYLENDRMDDADKSKSWGLVDIKRHKHPYEDKKGWVTLEAVPWSTSKISKWQSNNKNEPKPWDNNSNKPQSNWNTKLSNNPYKNTYMENGSPNNNYSPNNNNFNDNDFNNGYEDQFNSDNIFMDKPVANYDVDIRPEPNFPPTFPERPQFSKPTYGMDVRPIKIKPDPSDWPSEIPSKPSWNLRPSSQNTPQKQWNNNPIPDPWLDRNPSPVFMYGSEGYKDDNRDIITDGRPGDFPKPVQNPFQGYEPIQERPSVAISTSHPPSHPINGNGEWVLVSTTKGYQYPRNKRQRSIEVTPNSIGTRRGIRLTVLPPDNDTDVNMTTSHGGLLEVESTFETVEESHNKHTTALAAAAAASGESMQEHHPNKTRFTTNKHVKRPVRTQVVVTRKPNAQRRPVSTVKQVKPVASSTNHDATAVLAAVGAGMVPATMAMLVPFVTGRKKRNVDNYFQEKNNSSKVHMFTYAKS